MPQSYFWIIENKTLCCQKIVIMWWIAFSDELIWIWANMLEVSDMQAQSSLVYLVDLNQIIDFLQLYLVFLLIFY